MATLYRRAGQARQVARRDRCVAMLLAMTKVESSRSLRATGGSAAIFLRRVLAGAVLLIAVACGPADRPAPPSAESVTSLPWDSIVARGRETTVTWRMWRGDPLINAYVDDWVAPRLAEEYGIRLETVQGQGAEIVNQLTVEREAGARGFGDLVWINGETFHNLRSESLLWGPWAHLLPSAASVDSTSAIIMRDFEQELDGFESPWGRVQFALIYDSERTPDPPQTIDELGRWIQDNPGRFTHDQSFTGITFLKVLLYGLNGGIDAFQGGFDETSFDDGAARLWDWLEEHGPYFWREGTVYPAGVAELHRLFANREVDFAMSNNENEVVAKVRQGLLPPTSRAIVLRDGTIANAHYVGIPFNATNPEGAMVVANFLLSPAAQLEKARHDVWGDGTVLDLDRLGEEWRQGFENLSTDPAAIPPDTLRAYAVPEVAPEYHMQLEEEWRRRIRSGGG